MVTKEKIQTINRAKQEIKEVLRRYRVRWEEVVPDRDESNWEEVKPFIKEIRRELFRKRYSSQK
jgi:hypothetical protein